MLLSRHLTGRKRVPLFVTGRAARRDLGLTAADLDEPGRARLSDDHAEVRRRDPASIAQSSLSHDAELGTGAPMLQAKSGAPGYPVSRPVRPGGHRGARPVPGVAPGAGRAGTRLGTGLGPRGGSLGPHAGGRGGARLGPGSPDHGGRAVRAGPR